MLLTMQGVTRREIALFLAVAAFGFWAVNLTLEPRRQQQRRGQCYSNLYLIGLAFAQYSQDHDDTLPRAWFGHDPGPSDARTNYKWMDAIFPYVKNEASFTCPADHESRPYHFRSGQNYGSYVMNDAYYLPGDAQTPPAGARLNRIAVPANVILVTDGANDFQFAWPDASHTPPRSDGYPLQLDTIRGRHDREWYRAATPLACDGSTSSAGLGFAIHTKTINGRTIYPALTVEND